MGEEGSDCLLSAAVVVGNPFNLEVANICLQNSLLGKEVYQRVMGSACREVRGDFFWTHSCLTNVLCCLANMKKLITRHKDSISKYTQALDFEAISKVTYLYEFDRAVQ